LIREINQGNVANRANLLEFLGEEADRRSNPDSPQQIATDYVFIGELSEAELNQLKSIAQQLKEAGAISDRVYQKIQRRAGITIQLELQLFNFAADWMRGDEAPEPERIQPVLDNLQRSGLITSDNRTKLSLDLKTGKAEDGYDIVRYLENTKIFNLRDYSRDPVIYFPQIHREVAQLLTKAGAANLSTATFKLQFLDVEEDNALISTKVDSRKYEFASHYSAARSQNHFFGMIDGEFIQLFNKILRDQKSSYRLYTVGFFSDEYGAFGLDYSRFAVLVLTEEQAKQLHRWTSSYLAIGLEDHSSAFNSDLIDSILSLIESIGLLSHLTPQQKTEGKQKIARQYINSSYELLAAFDNLLISFDWETGNLENPYQALTKRFAVASRGAFQPTEISNEFDYDQKIAGQSFVVKGVRYSTKLEFNGDWLDSAFIAFLDRVIAETVPDVKFYTLYDGLSEVGYLFLTQQQRQVLEAEKLITLEPVSTTETIEKDTSD
jgi:hypothetical protein